MIDLARPGIMLYFDVRPCLKRLTMEQQGELFNAILDFGENGVVPSFDGVLGVAWDFIMPRLVRDNERYEKPCPPAALQHSHVGISNQCKCIFSVRYCLRKICLSA